MKHLEKSSKPISGFIGISIILIVLASALYTLITRNDQIPLLISAIALIFLVAIGSIGFCIVNPNESLVLTLFGKYTGTIKENGFFWTNPFLVRARISLRARNMDSEPIKVNDKIGNPIMIGVVIVWRVTDTFKAAFEVNDYEHFIVVQSDSAVRKLAGLYPYDNFEGEHTDMTLRSGGENVNRELEKELQERLDFSGIEIMEARINYLAYAQEIAGAMLKRQQATAIVAARTKIVEGAVGMVELALHEMSEKKIVVLDEERKANMVSNLMVVLCSDKDTSPIVNAGSLY